jgi:hypothetical protein
VGTIVFAETMQIDAGAVALALLALGIALTALIVGFACAFPAGSGSRVALAFWIPALIIEVLICLAAIRSVVSGQFNGYLLFPLACLVAQGALFHAGGKRRPH